MRPYTTLFRSQYVFRATVDGPLGLGVVDLLAHVGGAALWVGVGADESAYFWLDNHVKSYSCLVCLVAALTVVTCCQRPFNRPSTQIRGEKRALYQQMGFFGEILGFWGAPLSGTRGSGHDIGWAFPKTR